MFPQASPDGNAPSADGAPGGWSLLSLLSRFSIVGVLATGTYFTVANFALALTDIETSQVSVIAYLSGMLVSFFGHKLITFRIQERWLRHAVRFFSMSAMGLFVSYYAMIVTTEVFLAPPFWGTVAVTILIPALSFVTMKLWVFER